MSVFRALKRIKRPLSTGPSPVWSAVCAIGLTGVTGLLLRAAEKRRAARRLSILADMLRNSGSTWAEAEKTAKAKARLFDVVSHELEDPLVSMVLSSDFLLRTHTEDEWLKRLLTSVSAAGRQMLRLTSDLREANRVEAAGLSLQAEHAETDLTVSLNRAFDMVRKSVTDKAISLDLALPGELPKVDANPERVAQVLRNLLEGAVRLAQPGGTINIRVEKEREFAKISICNSDVIPKAYDEGLPPYFERIWQKERAYLSADSHALPGIAFSMAKAIIEGYGGRIWYDAGAGAGNAVVFTLRIVAAGDALR